MNEPFNRLGVKILPTNIGGMSPVDAEFTIIAGELAEAYSVDFADGKHEAGVLMPDGEYMIATITHQFKYRKGWSKYRAHAYYPIVTVYGCDEDGAPMQTTINTEHTGRSLTIMVSDANV